MVNNFSYFKYLKKFESRYYRDSLKIVLSKIECVIFLLIFLSNI